MSQLRRVYIKRIARLEPVKSEDFGRNLDATDVVSLDNERDVELGSIAIYARGMSAEERLIELGIELPVPPTLPFTPRLKSVVVHAGPAYLSGKGDFGCLGRPPECAGTGAEIRTRQPRDNGADHPPIVSPS